MKNKTSINHMQFFHNVNEGNIILSTERDADHFTTWKVGKDVFYAYGILQSELTSPVEAKKAPEQPYVRMDNYSSFVWRSY